MLNNKDILLPIISVVVLEWNNYLPVLAFLPLTPHWIWILDPHWKFIYARLFPDCVFIDGFNISLPAVDIEKSVVDEMFDSIISCTFLVTTYNSK